MQRLCMYVDVNSCCRHSRAHAPRAPGLFSIESNGPLGKAGRACRALRRGVGGGVGGEARAGDARGNGEMNTPSEMKIRQILR